MMQRRIPFSKIRFYAVCSSEGKYFIFTDYIDAVLAVASLQESYHICIDAVQSREEGMRLIQALNVHNQIMYQENMQTKGLRTLPENNRIPYGAKGFSSPVRNYTGSYYVIICSNGQYFCAQSITDVANWLTGLNPMPHIQIQRYNTVDEASRQVLARDAAIQALNGEKVRLLPPIQEDRPYGVQGSLINNSTIRLNQGGDF